MIVWVEGVYLGMIHTQYPRPYLEVERVLRKRDLVGC